MIFSFDGSNFNVEDHHQYYERSFAIQSDCILLVLLVVPQEIVS